MFIGYALNNVACKFFVIEYEVSGIDANTIIESNDATFFEDVFFL